MLLGFYFLAFSGLRSALVSAVFGGIYWLLVHRGVLKSPGLRVAFLPVILVVFLFSIFTAELQNSISPYLPKDIRVLLFRTETEPTDEQINNASFRSTIIAEQLVLAQTSPITGVGTFDSTAFSDEFNQNELKITGSEAFLTGLFTRVGIPVIFFVLALLSATSRGVRAGYHLPMVMGISIFIAMLVYGSLINAYNFVFLLMIGLLVPTREINQKAVRREPSELPTSSI